MTIRIGESRKPIFSAYHSHAKSTCHSVWFKIYVQKKIILKKVVHVKNSKKVHTRYKKQNRCKTAKKKKKLRDSNEKQKLT